MDCVTTGCGGTAKIQWSQVLGAEEVERHVDNTHENLVKMAEVKRVQLRIQMAALQDAADSPPKGLSGEDLQVFLAQAARQIEAHREEHNSIPTNFDMTDFRADEHTKALGHCPDHMHEDLEWYGRVHLSTCDGTPGCGCPDRPTTEEAP